MKADNLGIQDIFNPQNKYTFLVGAGVSREEPSCMPTGFEMMKSIVEYCCSKNEIQGLIQLIESERLRFEQLIGLMQVILDNELYVIDYYGECTTPNIQHFFLAEQISNGQFVMTTNFDCLIEIALLELHHLQVPNEIIIPVITKDDFIKYSDPIKLSIEGKKVIYKIHGSSKNIIKKDEDTKNSLIATIDALGQNKEGNTIFQLENFKQDAIINITKNRTLVMMGYSGSDDFDIIPTLKELKELNGIIWINHVPNHDIRESIHEIEENFIENYTNNDKITRILIEFKNRNKNLQVYRVDASTTKLVKKLINAEPEISPHYFTLEPSEWLKNNDIKPDIYFKNIFSFRIYAELQEYRSASRCLDEIKNLSDKNNDTYWLGTYNINKAVLEFYQGELDIAEKSIQKAIDIDKDLDFIAMNPYIIHITGDIYRARGNFQKALRILEPKLDFLEKKHRYTILRSSIINTIGEVYLHKSNYEEALQKFNIALKIVKKIGNLTRVAVYLNNISEIYIRQGNIDEANKCLKEALEIVNKINDRRVKAKILNQFGNLYKSQGENENALNCYEEALDIDEKIKNLEGKVSRLNNIASIYLLKGKIDDAFEKVKESLKIDCKIRNIDGIAYDLDLLAKVYLELDDNKKAYYFFEHSLNLFKITENRSAIATVLNNFATALTNEKKYTRAKKKLKEALKIVVDLREPSEIIVVRMNLVNIHTSQRYFNKALFELKKVEDILDKHTYLNQPYLVKMIAMIKMEIRIEKKI